MVANPAARRIDVAGLTKSFGPVRAVDNLSFTVEPGSVTGFLGPNGAGKTTTLRMLLGLITPDAGSARIGGRSYAELPAPPTQVGAVSTRHAAAGITCASTAPWVAIHWRVPTRCWSWSA
jgi:ABC-2 type transport system ATP-binding protein